MLGSGFWSSRFKNKGSQTPVDIIISSTDLTRFLDDLSHVFKRPSDTFNLFFLFAWNASAIRSRTLSYTHHTHMHHSPSVLRSDVLIDTCILVYCNPTLFIRSADYIGKSQACVILLNFPYFSCRSLIRRIKLPSLLSDRWKKAETIELTRTFVWSVDGLCS